jgi:hypothetical protein
MDVDKATQRALERLNAHGFESLVLQEKTLAAIWALEGEVNNGGFDQFFFNSAGDLAFYAPVALRTIGADQMAVLAEEANSVFGPSGPPKEWAIRQAKVQQFSDEIRKRLERLDILFCKYPDDIRSLLEAYVAQNSR